MRQMFKNIGDKVKGDKMASKLTSLIQNAPMKHSCENLQADGTCFLYGERLCPYKTPEMCEDWQVMKIKRSYERPNERGMVL